MINAAYFAHSFLQLYNVAEKQFVTRFWKISLNVSFHASNIYDQNEEWEPPITLTVAKVCSLHLKLSEINVKYFETFVTPLLMSL